MSKNPRSTVPRMKKTSRNGLEKLAPGQPTPERNKTAVRQSSQPTSSDRPEKIHGDRELLTQTEIKNFNTTLFSFLEKRGIKNLKKFAELCGFKNANVLYNLRHGQCRMLSLPTYLIIARTLRVSMDELLGLEKTISHTNHETTLIVRARAQAGLLQNSPHLPLVEQYQISFKLKPHLLAEGAFAVEHIANESNNVSWRSLLLALPFRPTHDRLENGQMVIVQRREGNQVEVSTGIIEINTSGLYLIRAEFASVDKEAASYKLKNDGRFYTTKGSQFSIDAVVFATLNGSPETFLL